MEKLIIDRTKWRTGGDSDFKTGEGKTSLLNEQGYMCCLGFECIRRGLERSDILSVGDPVDVFYECNSADKRDELVNKLANLITTKDNEYGGKVVVNTNFVDKAIEINDDDLITREEKETKLLPLFANIGIEIEFIN